MAVSESVDKETKEQAFVRLATARTMKAIKAIRLLQNLKGYPHTHAHTNKIVTTLRTEVENVEYALGGDKSDKSSGFNLDDEE